MDSKNIAQFGYGHFRNKKRSKIIFEKDLNCLIANMNCGFEAKTKKNAF